MVSLLFTLIDEITIFVEKSDFSLWIETLKAAPALHKLNRNQGPVSRKPRKPFGPVKPFLVHLYLKTEKCMHLKLLV